MRLAIVGSTLLAGNEEALEIIHEVILRYKPTLVVSGGAEGIDTMAVQVAEERNIQTLEYKPEHRGWEDKNGKKGFRSRNLQIAQNCDALVRIVSSKTTTFGSGWTKLQAEALGVPTEDYVVQQP